jgi:S-adenosylmethionine:tRNA ribosyltransferase-isomerase
VPDVDRTQQRDVVASQQPLRTDELDYELPAELIATRPAEPRDSARLLVMHRGNDSIEHHHVRDLPRLLSGGDVLVFNTTAVAPARLIGRRQPSGGKVEGLFVSAIASSPNAIRWLVMLKAGGRIRKGDQIELLDSSGEARCLITLVESRNREWEVELSGANSTAIALDWVGRTPLPPYILKARGDRVIDDELDRRWYQTVYASAQQRESIAAPTAGLHFTSQLLEQLSAGGVRRVDVTLHVGPGTFKPVTAHTLDQHIMHAESFFVSDQAIAALRETRQKRSQSGGRVLAVGTTSVRTLESLPALDASGGDFCGPISGMTDLLIAPPYEFKNVDGMLTNFHLPRSTLMALVAAMVGLDRLKAVYREAIGMKYRFYSYGDAMLILP